jgi:hypothetical protein
MLNVIRKYICRCKSRDMDWTATRSSSHCYMTAMTCISLMSQACRHRLRKRPAIHAYEIENERAGANGEQEGNERCVEISNFGVGVKVLDCDGEGV